MNIAMTGDTGLIGTELKEYLLDNGATTVSLSRNNVDIHSTTDLGERLSGVNIVVHLAGVAHNPNASYDDYYQGNVVFTKTLCQQIATANSRNLCNVTKIIMISSIKAMGESTRPGEPFRHNDECEPEDDYGKTKLAAEKQLREVCDNAGIEWAVIRPPLVLSKKVRGNLGLIQTISQKGIPIPLAGIDNKRDLVSIHNLCSVILAAIKNPNKLREVFLVSDGKPLSTPEVIEYATKTSARRAKLIKLPQFIRNTLTQHQHKHGLLRRLFGNLEVDINYTCKTLNWHPKKEP